MRRIQSTIALITVWIMAATAIQGGQAPPDQQQDHGWYKVGSMSKWYSGTTEPAISVSNSSRLDALVRAGKLYLSLQDCIAAALENNIDIEVQRYAPKLAEADLLRAKAGSAIRGIATQALTTTTASATGTPVATTTATAVVASSGATSTGPAPLSLDPALVGNIQFGHYTTPQSTTFLTNTNTLITRQKTANFGYQQQFLTGTTAQFGFNNNNTDSTSLRNQFNPVTASYMELYLSQHLLQGFGLAVNNRNIRIAKNNLQVADLIFKQQATNTVANVIGLYWDLVAFNEDAAVKRQALALSQKLYEDNKKQVEIGTLAPIEIVRAEAEVASREQDLTTSETSVLQQETIIKNAISRNGVASPTLAEVRIVPTDRIRLPQVEPVLPIQDLVGKALEKRPELAQLQVQVDNSRISLKGTKNSLLPTIDAFFDAKNRGQAGSLSILPGASGGGDAFFLGGYGSVLDQIFARNFPDYSAGFSLTIPLRNRSAQADYSTAQLSLRQSELNYQRQINNIRVDVQNALIALTQARARYQAAEKNRVLQEQTLDAEQKKYALGASTVFLVIQAQRDLATAEGNRVAALSAYAHARTQLDLATGQTLDSNGIQIDDAKRGVVPTAPAPLPVLEEPGPGTAKK